MSVSVRNRDRAVVTWALCQEFWFPHLFIHRPLGCGYVVALYYFLFDGYQPYER